MTDDQARSAEIAGEIGARLLAKQSASNLNPTDVGAHIALVSTSDPHTRLQPNATGVVTGVDDAGTVHVAWDDGSTLGLIPGVDEWRRVHPRWYDAPMQEVTP
ncbi:DUF4314 domain-containing protein [Microbacterium sp. QXD-8]|uniref:DUF4314 domain-containing protein n=1 Tax=Microbacterium psychrotolerans TaxID=3068321 RepID=A0ABU0YYA3_9MICO|nr:DUF4314 domain-containing protein [Microbacterium sp. QXD-8]MDQ7877313.1 DUF4314 domain-containing protein [Microbacterium sp. QXD-8]